MSCTTKLTKRCINVPHIYDFKTYEIPDITGGQRWHFKNPNSRSPTTYNRNHTQQSVTQVPHTMLAKFIEFSVFPPARLHPRSTELVKLSNDYFLGLWTFKTPPHREHFLRSDLATFGTKCKLLFHYEYYSFYREVFVRCTRWTIRQDDLGLSSFYTVLSSWWYAWYRREWPFDLTGLLPYLDYDSRYSLTPQQNMTWFPKSWAWLVAPRYVLCSRRFIDKVD